MEAPRPQRTIAGPNGHCRKCRELVRLEQPEVPKQARNGRLVVSGTCGQCATKVTGFFTPSSIEALPARMDTLAVALVAIGQRSGYQAALAVAREDRADAVLRLQQELSLTHAALARVFRTSKHDVRKLLADAHRRREV